MIKTLHHEDQRRGRLTTRYRPDHLQSLRERGFVAAERARHSERQQSRASQTCEVFVGKMRAFVERGCAAGKLRGQRRQPALGLRTVQVGECGEGIGVAFNVAQGGVGMSAGHTGLMSGAGPEPLGVSRCGERELFVEAWRDIERGFDHVRAVIQIRGFLLFGDQAVVDGDRMQLRTLIDDLQHIGWQARHA
jgi:hypothetical protein